MAIPGQQADRGKISSGNRRSALDHLGVCGSPAPTRQCAKNEALLTQTATQVIYIH